jgi:hypothetical protein
MDERDTRQRRVDEIVKRLTEISEMDQAIVQPKSSVPVTINLEDLFDYGERFEERQRLLGELKGMVS